MKKVFLLFILPLLYITVNADNWIGINSSVPTPAKIQLVSSDINHSVVHFKLDGFSLKEVLTPRGNAYTVSVGKSTPILDAGSPDLPKLTASLIIPDKAGMSVRVVSSSYTDYPNLEIAPSKGNLLRTVDPSTVPYQYGKIYSVNKFFPIDQADVREPFIVRDLRGQTLIVYPFQYNPVTKILRVYSDLTVELYKVSETGANPLIRNSKDIRLSREFLSIYSHEFLNLDVMSYAPLGDYGKMLVISYGAFMDAMQPYVKWKNSIGIPTEMINVTIAGTTAAAIKTYIENYFNTNGLTFVLLVGDIAQIPTNTNSGLGGPSDNAYGYIVGNDHYADLFVGRFSAETVAHVQTQVQRTLDYEKNPQLLTDDWYTTVIGIASDQGPGDDGEYDYQHVRNQQTQLLTYTYTWNPELFDGSQGGNDAPGNPSPAQVADAVNNGASLILYCGHGSTTSWGTSGFSNTNVNALTNQGKLPFIWSVACVNGEFMNGTCFAEAWLRATQNGQPTGAIAFLGATINQSWDSPMEGQDEMTDILAESYPTNIKRTFAGLSINGCMKMIDSYGLDGSNMADTWTVFGDPAIMVRTDNPQTMIVSHDSTLFVGSTSMTVTCNVNGARVTATLHDTILATTLVSGNTAILNFAALQTPNDSVHLVVTAYNYIPDISDILVITPNGPYVIYANNHVNDTTGNQNHLIDYGEEILLSVYLKNVGVATVSNLNVKIRTTNSHITLIDSLENYGSMSPNQVKTVIDAFTFHTANNIPDGQSIPITVISEDSATTWTSNFTLTAHAPVLEMADYIVIDSTGNNNGRLDPGETAWLKILVKNSGSSDAFDVNGHLISINPNVTVTSDIQNYGNLSGGAGAYRMYMVEVSSSAPEGQTAPFLLEISAQKGITGVGSFNLIIGKIPVLIVDYDGNANSGTEMKNSVENLGLFADYKTTNIPDTLSQYSSVFVCLGVYDQNHVLSNTDGQKLADYLTNGGRLYMEGGDTWAYDPATPVHPMFKINGLEDGYSDLGTILGFAGTFSEGMTFTYSGDNQYIDRIAPTGTAFPVFKNQDPSYFTTVAYDGGNYRTIGSSSEYGGLTDSIYPSTKLYLMEEYLNWFGIQIPPLMANFIGYPTTILPGSTVNFTDFSTGAISNRSWSFPGGTPSSSTDKNPVIVYNFPGTYDVQLIVSDGVTSDTLLRTNYINADWPTGSSNLTRSLTCKVNPNPGPGLFHLELNSQEDVISIHVMNAFGQVIYQENNLQVNGTGYRTIDLTNQPQGLYFLVLKGEDKILTRKLVISR